MFLCLMEECIWSWSYNITIGESVVNNMITWKWKIWARNNNVGQYFNSLSLVWLNIARLYILLIIICRSSHHWFSFHRNWLRLKDRIGNNPRDISHYLCRFCHEKSVPCSSFPHILSDYLFNFDMCFWCYFVFVFVYFKLWMFCIESSDTENLIECITSLQHRKAMGLWTLAAVLASMVPMSSM